MTYQVSRIDKLYLIRVKHRAVAIITARSSSEAISKYLTRTGFDSNYRYLCSYLMTNTITTSTTKERSNYNVYPIIKANTKTINGTSIDISPQYIVGCDDIDTLIDPKDISNPLFMRPTIREVRKCIEFGNVTDQELRKFCI